MQPVKATKKSLDQYRKSLKPSQRSAFKRKIGAAHRGLVRSRPKKSEYTRAYEMLQRQLQVSGSNVRLFSSEGLPELSAEQRVSDMIQYPQSYTTLLGTTACYSYGVISFFFNPEALSASAAFMALSYTCFLKVFYSLKHGNEVAYQHDPQVMYRLIRHSSVPEDHIVDYVIGVCAEYPDVIEPLLNLFKEEAADKGPQSRSVTEVTIIRALLEAPHLPTDLNPQSLNVE